MAKELSMEELRAKAQEKNQQRTEGQPKTERVGVADLNKECSIRKSYELPSTIKGAKSPTYQAAVLLMADGTERWKSLNGWDMEAIGSGATKFRIASVEHKGSIKLVLKAVEQKTLGGNPSSSQPDEYPDEAFI